MVQKKFKLIVGITGATGAIYGIRLLEYLSKVNSVETSLIISEAAEITIKHETDYKIDKIKALANRVYDINDIGAPLASGSYKRDGMIVIPCSVKTMAALANSLAMNLLIRAGDVTLKEKKPLVLAVRETPLHLGHLRNMVALSEIGATIMPLCPSFYHRPKSLTEIVDFTVGRALNLVGIENSLAKEYKGSSK
ncbi:MAG: 3-octaprenyl-4-hydroxybenzoate carboxy-lyase [Candidatus Schekmanbacteria bacterium RBG_16_38_11]|uniref:Flavin prenyltransferase UbiX n=1 Tax=Candidatus Schekmanbacteria bacterium RBG_16_38_11 TaxID=1817880 RepID=A0A1F7RSM2_9BACT|nr:MAG: 3-octaprenyl-4-hydroxybenzoate carboxy-lyase [Candidatus Schekmanbacteria bacterium RBG_16_38_11]